MLNPVELELELFCRGLRVPDDVPLTGVRLLQAMPQNGLEVVLPTESRLKSEIWVNVPVAEDFAARSPFRLAGGAADGYRIEDDRDASRYPVRLPPPPHWYSRRTSREVPMGDVGQLQGSYLSINVNPACSFWTSSPPLNCRFCTGDPTRDDTKTLSDAVETCWAAREESAVTFVHLHAGEQTAESLSTLLPFVRAIKEEVGMLVGVQAPPEPAGFPDLVRAGVDQITFCVEFFDPVWFGRFCPGKAAIGSRERFFDAVREAVRLMPRGAVLTEIIAGVEPIERTLDAIDFITDLGAVPVISIFRPALGSDVQQWPPPAPSDMGRAVVHAYEACRRAWLPIGVAPNVEISRVVIPDDGALLADRTMRFYAYETFRKLVRTAAMPVFGRRLQARPRAA